MAGQDSSVGIVTRYGLDDWQFKPGLEQEFSPSHTHGAHIQRVLGLFSWGVKRPDPTYPMYRPG